MRHGQTSSGDVVIAAVRHEGNCSNVQYLEDRIYEFTSSATDIANGDLLAFFVRDRDDIVAGIRGND